MPTPRSDDRVADFEQLFVSLHPRLMRYASYLLDSDAAADVAGQTMFTLWKKKADIGRTADDPRLNALAFRIVDGLIRNTQRASKRRRILIARLIDHRERDDRMDDVADIVTTSSEAKAVLTALSPADRQLIGLLLAGFRSRELALALGVSPGAAAMRLQRLRSRLTATADPDQPSDREEDGE